MRKLLSYLSIAIIAGFITPAARAARAEVSVDFFHQNLEPYGNWREVGDLGYCWHPRDVGEDWSPYSDGRWVYTDAGWTWDSDEPYGWAVYHYGRWANVARVGWVWIPGNEWGPGWVSWRRSPRYVGWAPLPPEALFLRAVGLSVWVDDHYDIGPGSYRFVEGRDFGLRRLNSVFIDRRSNFTIIRQTTNITNITYVNNVVHNGGMAYEEQSRISSTPLARYKLDRRQDFDGDPGDQKPGSFRSKVSGDSLSMLAPSFKKGSSGVPAKIAGKVEKAEINRGWEGAGNEAEVTALRTQLKSKIAAPRELPAQVREEKTPKPAVRPDPDSSPGRKPARADPRPIPTPKPTAKPKREKETPPSKEKTRPMPLDQPPAEDQPRTPAERKAKRSPDTRPEPPAVKPQRAEPAVKPAPSRKAAPPAGKEPRKKKIAPKDRDPANKEPAGKP